MNISNLGVAQTNQHNQYKSELIKWIVAQGFTHGLSLSHHLGVRTGRGSSCSMLGGSYKMSGATIQPEQDRSIAKSEINRRGVSLDRVKADIKRLHRDIDRKLLGCRYNASPDRAYGLFVVEGREDMATLHVHALLKIAPQNHGKFERLFADDVAPERNLWKRIAPSGSHKLIVNHNPAAAATYLTKYIRMDAPADRMLFSHDFISASSVIGI